MIVVTPVARRRCEGAGRAGRAGIGRGKIAGDRRSRRRRGRRVAHHLTVGQARRRQRRVVVVTDRRRRRLRKEPSARVCGCQTTINYTTISKQCIYTDFRTLYAGPKNLPNNTC